MSPTTSKRAPRPAVVATGVLDDVKAWDVPGRWRHALAAGVFALLVLIVFGQLLFSGGSEVVSSTQGDVWRQFWGWYDFGFGELRHGHLPLWNPYVFCGAPFFAGFQSALLYPPNWLYLLLPLPVALNVSVAIHVFAAGLCMYFWATYRGLHFWAALFAGVVYMFGGAFFVQIYGGHLPHICVMSLAPLIFLAIDDLTLTRSLRGALLGSLAVAMQIFAGHPQYVFYTAVGAGIYFLLNLPRSASRGNAVLGFLLSYVGGALLAGVQLIAGIQATSEAMRSKVSIEFASTFAFPPENLLTLVMPGYFGDMTHTPYWGRWFLWEESVFIGVTALAMVIIAASTRPATRRFALTMVAIVFLIGMGRYTPLFQLIYRLPGFGSFRGISKIMFLFVMFLALLAGIGFDWVLRARRLPLMPAIAGSVAAGIFGIMALVVAGGGDFWPGVINSIDIHDIGHQYVRLHVDNAFVQQSASQAARELGWAALLCVLFCGLVVTTRRDRRWALGFLALGAVESVVFGCNYHSSFKTEEMDQRQAVVGQMLDRFGRESRFWAPDQVSMLSQKGLNAWGDDPMQLRRYVEFFASAEGISTTDLQMTGGRLRGSPLWDLIRLRYFVGYGSLKGPQLARAQLLTRYELSDSRDRTLARLAAPGFDRLHSVVLESTPDPSPAETSEPGTVQVKDINSDQIEVTANVKSPALLVLSDAYSSGWRARPMGESAQSSYRVMPADHVLRAIPLRAGVHHLVLFYRPVAFIVGAWISALSWMGFALVCVSAFRRRRRLPITSA